MNGVSVVDVLSVLALFLCLCAKKRTFLIASHGKWGNLYVMVVAKSLPINHLSRLFRSNGRGISTYSFSEVSLKKRGGLCAFPQTQEPRKPSKIFSIAQPFRV